MRAALSLSLSLSSSLSAGSLWAQPGDPTEIDESESSALASDAEPGAPAPARDFASPPPREPIAQRRFALLAVAMPYDGFGLGVRAQGPRVGLDVSATFRPVLASYSTHSGKFPELELLAAYQLNGSLCFGLYRPNFRTDLGFSLGYKYSTLLGHGASAAFYLQRELSSHFTFLLFVGPAVFPRAERRIRNETGWLGGSVSSGLAWHQGGLGLSLAFFP